jgi:prepilin-type N-terminal cleavage/methylation domain-containing protein
MMKRSGLTLIELLVVLGVVLLLLAGGVCLLLMYFVPMLLNGRGG